MTTFGSDIEELEHRIKSKGRRIKELIEELDFAKLTEVQQQRTQVFHTVLERILLGQALLLLQKKSQDRSKRNGFEIWVMLNAEYDPINIARLVPMGAEVVNFRPGKNTFEHDLRAWDLKMKEYEERYGETISDQETLQGFIVSLKHVNNHDLIMQVRQISMKYENDYTWDVRLTELDKWLQSGRFYAGEF